MKGLRDCRAHRALELRDSKAIHTLASKFMGAAESASREMNSAAGDLEIVRTVKKLRKITGIYTVLYNYI